MRGMSQKDSNQMLADIFGKLNLGLAIDYLDIKEKEFLCEWYGENWRERVEKICKHHRMVVEVAQEKEKVL